MRRTCWSRAFLFSAACTSIAGCRSEPDADAYGNFEAEEVVVSAESAGQIEWFTPKDGSTIAQGATVGLIDTAQLALQAAQLLAQRGATTTRVGEAAQQVRVLEVQRQVARRSYERTQRLFGQRAATALELDQREREYRTLVAQIAAAEAHRRTIEKDAVSSDATVAQIRERISRSAIVNPRKGTVLSAFARAGEVVQPGQPLYKIANLDTLTLRAYIAGDQLASVKLGQRVSIHATGVGSALVSASGTVSWIASTAEFTPTPIQTRDERADLVYAIKILVPNERGVFKIGMPADVALSPSK